MIDKKKSDYWTNEIHYLGLIISKDGVRMDPHKIKSLEERHELKTTHEVQSFIGLYTY